MELITRIEKKMPKEKVAFSSKETHRPKGHDHLLQPRFMGKIRGISILGTYFRTGSWVWTERIRSRSWVGGSRVIQKQSWISPRLALISIKRYTNPAASPLFSPQTRHRWMLTSTLSTQATYLCSMTKISTDPAKILKTVRGKRVIGRQKQLKGKRLLLTRQISPFSIWIVISVDTLIIISSRIQRMIRACRVMGTRLGEVQEVVLCRRVWVGLLRSFSRSQSRRRPRNQITVAQSYYHPLQEPQPRSPRKRISSKAYKKKLAKY